MKIDRAIPIISSQDTIYPGNQYAIRNGQNVTLRVNVTDGNGSGILNVSVDADSIGGPLSPMTLIAGGSGSYQTGTFEKNITVNASDGTNLLTITSYDNSSPLPNIASGINFIVEVDNAKPVITSTILVTFHSPATISWTTDENSTSLVKYGTQTGVYTFSVFDPSYNTSHSITLTNASSPGTTYYFVVNSTDGAGNSIQSGEYSFTINDSENSETPSSPGGGGGGGGGGGSTTSFEVWIRDVSAGQTFELDIDDEDIPYINGLSLTANQDIYTSKLAITDLDKKPWSGMADPDANVLRYFKVGYDKDNSVKTARFRVSVNKSWLKANDVDPYKFSLYHYTTAWEKLDTKILKEDNESIFFEAATPGFSYFSLGGESGSGYRAIKEETSTVTTTTTTLKPTTTTIATGTPAPKTVPLQSPVIPTKGRWMNVILGVTALAVVIGGIFSYSVKRKARKGPTRKSEAPEEERPKPLLDPIKMQKEKEPDGKI
jgi:PGF-pre-PGF domain-containing protein